MKFQATENFYRSLFENTLDGLACCQMIFDQKKTPIDFMYVMANRNFTTLTGLKDVVGKKATELMPEIATAHPELFEIYGRVVSIGGTARFETYLESLDRWFLISAYSSGQNFFVAVFQNITDRKQIEKNLEDAKVAARNVLDDLSIEKSKVDTAKAKDEAMLASIGDGVIIVDPVGKVTLMNIPAQTMLGLLNWDIVGQRFFDLVRAEDGKGEPVPVQVRPMAAALAAGVSMNAGEALATSEVIRKSGGYYYVRQDRTKFPVAITVAPVKLENKIVGAIEVFRDITKEKEIDTAKTEFVSLASHQLRTPLSAVNWYTEMLLSGDAGELNEVQTKYLQEVYRGNQRMVVLVNALLNVSRLEMGTFLIEPEATNVVKLVQSVVDEQKPEADQRKLTLMTHFEPDLPLVQVDTKLLRMIIENLLSNAIKYTPAHGTVMVALHLTKLNASKKNPSRPADRLAIVVSDTGYGIPKAQQGKIFTKLFRGDNVREKDTEGTGLGLYIVKSIIDHCGGTIEFESKENKGSTFYLTLPLTGMKKKEGTKPLE